MILITSHTNADFDSLGCMVAARRLYPGSVLSFSGAAEAQVRRYIENHAEDLPPFTSLKNLDFDDIGRLVLVDVSDRDRLGPLSALLDRVPPVALDIYDHHPGQCNLRGEVHSVEEAGACSTIMVSEMECRSLALTPFEAGLCLLGIYEDTGFLTFPTTRPSDFAAATKCLAWGADLDQVSRVLHRSLTENQMRLLTELMGNLEAVRIGGLTVHLASLSSIEYIPDLSILMHEIINLEDLDVLFLLAYLENRVHIIGRSRARQIDVSKVLDVFGGGGHPSAASATLKGKTLEEARRLLLEEITAARPLGLKASDLYTVNFRRIEASTTVQEAFKEMNRFRVNALPVFSGPRLLGVISRQEVDGAVHHGLLTRMVGELVISQPPLLPPETPAEEVRRLMLERNWRIVLFGEGPEKVVGLLSRMNLFKSLYQLDEKPTPHRGGGQPSRQETLNRMNLALGPSEMEAIGRLGALAVEMNLPCRLVGGVVRDLLLQRELKDIDFVVEGDAIALAKAWAASEGGRVKAHTAFGTAVWLKPSGGHWDFATARAEFYEAPAALPTVAHAALYQDLYRRDFTINTLALDINPERLGEILDLFGGVRDLKAGRIRVLHGLSFVDDPTRAFRAVRFSVSLGFSLPQETATLIQSALSQGVFRNLSPKRVLAELAQIVDGAYAVEGLRALESHGLLAVVWPGLKITPKLRERLYRLQQAADFFDVHFGGEEIDRLSLFLMGLLEALPQEELKSFTGRYPMSKKSRDLLDNCRDLAWQAIREITRRDITAGQVYLALREPPLELALYVLARLDSPGQQSLVRDYILKSRFAELDISGSELIGAGVPPSAKVAQALLAAKTAMIDGLARTAEAQLSAALAAVEGASSPAAPATRRRRR